MKTLEQIIKDEIDILMEQTRTSGGNYHGILGKTRKAQLDVLNKIINEYKKQRVT